VQELGTLQHQDYYEMIATSLRYLQSKSELASMNTCGSVVVCCMFCHSITKMAKKHLEQHHAIKLCVKLGENTTNTSDKIRKAFGNDFVSHAQVFQWYKDFVKGQETVEDEL
jgi:hypothetical protein